MPNQKSVSQDGDLVFPQPTNDWREDCKAGRRFALTVVQQAKESENPMLLGRAMKVTEADDGIRVGFISALAELAVRGLGE